MNTDYRPTNSWDFRLRAAKLGELMSVRSLATLTLTVALIALLATLAALLALPLQAQSLTTFVGNTGGSGTADSNDFQAQSFETGANEGGYTVSQVYILLDDASGKSTSVSIKEDNGGEPGESGDHPREPGDIGRPTNSTRSRHRPAPLWLRARPTGLTLNEGISSNRAQFALTDSDDDSSAWGWSIGDDRLYRTSEMDPWSDSTSPLLMAISGTLSADATLSALALEDADGGEPITLSPAFDADTETYTAAVVNRIDTVKLTATKNDDNAMVVITNDDDDGTAEEAGLNLSVGSNTLTVTVTAQDGTATLTYTVTVERLAAPPPEVMVPSDWGLIPSDLGTGDQFRLVFLSSTKTDATSTDIEDYNTFIKSLAATGHLDLEDYSEGFRAVGCTEDVDARDNTNTNTDGAGVPIYWLNGNKAADDNADFYDGNWDDEANDKDESGADGPDTSQADNYPFTGCNHNGTEAVVSGTSQALGKSFVRLGSPNSTFSADGPLSSTAGAAKTTRRPMYGLSQVFEVPTTLVSNTHLSTSLNTNSFLAQSFETGANLGGYTVSEVDIRLGETSARSTSVKIRKNNADNQPGDLVATLNNPGTLTENSLNTFTAQDVITLDARTTYWISMGEGIPLSTNRAAVQADAGNDQTGETGWSIGDDRLWRTNELVSWSTSTSSLLMTIKGTAIPTISLVSNTHLSASSFTSSDFTVQSFATGANADGYTVSEVDIRFGETSGASTSVKIREDNDGEPGDLVATLTNPASLTADSLNTFTAPAGTTLAASKTYWISVNEGISSALPLFVFTSSDDETGETGWSIGDGRRWRNNETDPWTAVTNSLLIAIKGTGALRRHLVRHAHCPGLPKQCPRLREHFHRQ